MIKYDHYTICFDCDKPMALLAVKPGGVPIAQIDEDSLTCQDMADIEDGKPVCFDEGRHKRHVCREEQKEG